MKKACRPPTEACPQRHDTHPHAVRRDRPGDQPPGPDDSMRRGPGGAGEPGKVRARRPRYRSVWFSPSGEAPRRAWGRTGGTAPGDDDQAGGKEETGSPPPTSGLERPEGAARRPGVARTPADGEGGLCCPEGNIGRGQNAAPNLAQPGGRPLGQAGQGGAGDPDKERHTGRAPGRAATAC